MTADSPHRLIRAALGQPVDKTPVWLMRQAGRYLPEYRQLREKAGSFLNLCKTPELACEITLQPVRRFDIDGAIIFSDILTIPDAMGLPLQFVENEGPCFLEVIGTIDAVKKLSMPDPEQELRYVMDAIRLVKSELGGKLPVIGFAGSPWTLAAYMIEGKGKTEFLQARKMVYDAPHILHALLEKLSEAVALSLNAQIRAGVDIVMIFDTWGGLLTTEGYKDFSLAYIKKIISKLAVTPPFLKGADAEGGGGIFAKIPVIVFTKQGGQWLESILETRCDVIGIDWTTSLVKAKEVIGTSVSLQGNLDPAVLYASPEVIEKEVKKILSASQGLRGHIFNLGHGIGQHVPLEHVQVLVESVHRLSRKL